MTSYFDHNAHKTRPDKTKSATSWPVVESFQWFPTLKLTKDYFEKLKRQQHTYGGKKAGER